MSDKRYYWLRLPKDFFKRHDIRIIKSMPNGKDYVLFYLMLLLESITHDGNLRFSDTIPYSEEMLSVITDTNIDVVRSAMKILIELHMVEILDDKTIYLTEIEKMIGSESWSAERVRKFRERQSLQPVTLPLHVTQCNEEIEKELDIELDTEKENNKNSIFLSGEGKNDNEPEFVKRHRESMKRLVESGTISAETSTAADGIMKLRAQRGDYD